MKENLAFEAASIACDQVATHVKRILDSQGSCESEKPAPPAFIMEDFEYTNGHSVLSNESQTCSCLGGVGGTHYATDFFDCLPELVNDTQNCNIDLLINAQTPQLCPSLLEKVDLKLFHADDSTKTDHLEATCQEGLLFVGGNTQRIHAVHATHINQEVSSPREKLLFVPYECRNELCLREVTISRVPAVGVKCASVKDGFMQDTVFSESNPAQEVASHPPDDKGGDANQFTCTGGKEPASETILQHDKSTYGYLEGEENFLSCTSKDASSSQKQYDENFLAAYKSDNKLGDANYDTCMGCKMSASDISMQYDKGTDSCLEGEEKHPSSTTRKADFSFAVYKPHGKLSYTSRANVSLKKQTQQQYDKDSYKPDCCTEIANMKVDGPLPIALEGNLEHEELTNRHLNIEGHYDSFVRMGISSSEKCTSGDLSILKTVYKHKNGSEDLDQGGAGGIHENHDEPICVLSDRNAETRNEFVVGDLIWAKVRSYPWWPALIFDPAYASDSAKKLEQPGKFLVAFFGDYKFAWLLKSQMKAFRPHFRKKVKQTDTKTFRKAIAEALDEFCKISESGLVCCHYKGSLRSPNSFLDWQLGNDNSLMMQHRKKCFVNAERINPVKTLMFIKTVACTPCSASMFNLESSELRGHAYGFRACMVALYTAELSSNIEQKKANSAQTKLKLSHAGINLEIAVKAKEVGIRRNISAENEKDESETLLALASYHPRLLKRKKGSGKRANLQHHMKKVYRSTLGQEDNAKAFSSPKCCSKLRAKATTQASHKRAPKRRASESNDIFNFISSDSEEDSHEANVNVSKKAKNYLSRMVTGNTHSGTKEILETEGKERIKKVGSVGDSMRMFAVKLSGTPPALKCISKAERSKTTILNKKVNGKVDKTARLSKGRTVICKAPPLQEECFASPIELFQTLQALARDPLNTIGKSCPLGTITTLLRFRNRISHKDFGKALEKIFVEEPENAAQGLPEEAASAVHMVYGDPGKSNKERLEVDQLGKSSAENPSKDAHVFGVKDADADKDNAEGGQCSKASADNPANDAQILCAQEKKGYRGILERDHCSKASENSLARGNSLPEAERLGTTDSTQTTQKRRPDAVEKIRSKSSKQCSTSSPRGQLELISVSNRELVESNLLETYEEPLPAPPPAIAMSSSTPYDMSIVPAMKLGLFMYFPKDFGLPSVSQLKTMFMQFGPLQPSGVRVFKESASAEVVFKCDQDAKAALKHVKRNAMFGPATVFYTLQQFSLSDLRKKSPAFSRGSSSRSAHAGVGNMTYQDLNRCAELASSLKQRAHEHLRAATATLEIGERVNRALSGQPARNFNRTRTDRRFNPVEDLVQERMQTLLRRLNLIVGSATSETK